MTEGEIKWGLLDDEEKREFFKSLLCYKGVYFLQVYFQLNNAESQEEYKVLPISKAVIQDVKNYFFTSMAFSKVNYLNDRTGVALPINIYYQLLTICQECGLEQFINHLALIISIASTEKISRKGKKPIINQNLSKLKYLLSSDIIEQTIEPSSGSHVALFKDKFSLEKVTLEFKHPTNDSIAHESVSFKGEEFKEHLLYGYMKFALEELIQEVQFSEKHTISSNTNILFCKSFYNFVDKETLYPSPTSTSRKADILRLFINIYKLAGYKFIGYKSNLDGKDELDIVETWLKTLSN